MIFKNKKSANGTLFYALKKLDIDFLRFFNEIAFTKIKIKKYPVIIIKTCSTISNLLCAKILNLSNIKLKQDVETIIAISGFINQSKILNFAFDTHNSLVMLSVAFTSSVKYTVTI